MLYSFSVDNFLSFKQKQELTLTPEPIKEKQEHLHIPYLYDTRERLLKSIAFYGHNSFGKSNLIKAYQFMVDSIFSSFTFGKTDDYFHIIPFQLNTDNKDLPSSFEVTFLLKEIKYRYSFHVSNGKIIKEDLWYARAGIRENYLFQRIDEAEIKVSKAWNKEAGKKMDQAISFTKSHHLFLSVLFSQTDIPYIEDIRRWFKRNIIITNINNDEYLKKALLILAIPEYRSTIQRFIENADLGFITIQEKIDSLTKSKLNLDSGFVDLIFANELKAFEIYTQHSVFNSNYKFVEHKLFELLKSESAGSIKFLVLACHFTYAIKNGLLLWVDELDSQLHVHLVDHLVKVFNSSKINVLGSQLLFTTHSTSILSNKLLRRDQIVLIDKNSFGETSIHKMHSRGKAVRQEISVDNKYLKGDIGVSQELVKRNKQTNLGFDFD